MKIDRSKKGLMKTIILKSSNQKFYRLMRSLFSILIMITLFTAPTKADIILVDHASANTTATRLAAVTNWSTAVNNLQTAIDAAQTNDEIWVKAGTYYPTAYPLNENGFPQGNTARDYTFYIEKTNLGLYGGFNGTETQRNQRDFSANVTTLSGDLGTLGTSTDNVHHVVLIAHVDLTTILDGFTISDGRADSGSQNFNYSRAQGAGIFNFAIKSGANPNKQDSHPTLRNLIVENNYANTEGGGMYNYSGFGGVGSPVIEACTFRNNTAVGNSNGAGIMIGGGSPTITDCVFDGNTPRGITASGYGATLNVNITGTTFMNHPGPGIDIPSVGANSNLTVNIDDCVFANNATGVSGAINMTSSLLGVNAVISNSVFYGNEGYSIRGYANNSTINADVTNCLFYDNVYYNVMSVDVSATNGGTNMTKLVNCTFTKNSGGVRAGGQSGGTELARAEAINCIFWDNTYNNSGVNNDFYNYWGSIITGYNMVSAALPSNVTDNGNTQVGVNPQFIDAPNNNYRVDYCSPAINVGDNASNTLINDLAGLPRIGNSIVDLGAYENPLVANVGVTSNATLVADYEHTTANGWTYYYDDNGTPSSHMDDIILLGIKKNGNNIGTVNDGTFQVVSATTSNYGTGAATGITNPPANYVINGAPWYVMNRYWDVTPTAQPTTDIEVRTFFNSTDISDMNGSLAPTSIVPSDLYFYKINGTSYDPNPDNGHAGVPQASSYNGNGYWQYSYGTTASQTTWALGDLCGNYYAEYVIAQFSGGGGGGSSAGQGALPVEWLSFEAALEGKNDVRLEWEVASETNNEGFEVEHSFDGRNWEYIGFVRGNGNSAEWAMFDFVDRNVSKGTHYYRLKQMDFDGNFEYSEVETVLVKADVEVRIFPNPVMNELSLAWNDENEFLNMRVIDNAGKVVASRTVTQGERLDVSHLPDGVYHVQLVTEDEMVLAVEKMIKYTVK